MSRHELEAEVLHAPQEGEKKQFAWMDSDDESGSSHVSVSTDLKVVPLGEVETLSQMTKLAPSLEKRLRNDTIESSELCEVARALARSRYFDPVIFNSLAVLLRRAFERKDLGVTDMINIICWLAELNAYDSLLFDVACRTLCRELGHLSESERQRVETALKQVNHDPGDEFKAALKTKKRGDSREACPMFWRGQCKWGPRCKLSHDPLSFESTAREGTWKPPSSSGGKSRGFVQSADLYKADKCGALW